MTKLQAMVESLWRTALQAALGAVVVYVGAGAVTDTTITSKQWWLGLLSAIGAAVVAALMRAVKPTATDHPGVARTDLPA